MKKLSVIMLLALAAAVGFFFVIYNVSESLGLYSRAVAFGASAGTILFFVILIAGIKRGTDYIRILNEEIHALEGGDLSREITIRGNDELAMLAESIDEFRKSMKDQLATIEQLEKNNRLMTAEIAHDLRTPLTSLIMYLDFALGELEGKEPQASMYMTKARERSVRLKVLNDENFNYSTLPDFFVIKKQAVQAYAVLSTYLRDLMNYLEAEGFLVRVDVIYGHRSILIQRDALERVFANLASNVTKYATKDEEVLLFARETESHVEVRITNRVRVFEGEKPESTGFGERIVKRLMEEMDGEYHTEESDGEYTMILRFAIA